MGSLLRWNSFKQSSLVDHSILATTPDNSISVEFPYTFSMMSDGVTVTPDLTMGSPSYSTSVDPATLSPPPRPKRTSFTPNNSMSLSRANAGSHRTTIDPAKWAEISISAADLVSQIGRENIVFESASPPHSDTDSLEEEIPTSSSLLERDDECGPLHGLHSSPYAGISISHGEDSSAIVDSMVGSMTSLSKWPLPPNYQRFESNEVA